MKGFTLVELLVVISIIMVITALVLNSQGSFNRTVTLANTAYDVALSIRSAETYGIDSHSINGNTNVGYGIDFQKTTPNSFRLFADSYPAPSSSYGVCHRSIDPNMPDARAGDCIYEPSGSGSTKDSLINVYTIANGMTISKFCAEQAGVWSCSNSVSNQLTSMDIVFVRPDPVPYISTNGFYDTITPATSACIALTSPQGGARYVKVTPSGEVIGNASSCP